MRQKNWKKKKKRRANINQKDKKRVDWLTSIHNVDSLKKKKLKKKKDKVTLSG